MFKINSSHFYKYAQKWAYFILFIGLLLFALNICDIKTSINSGEIIIYEKCNSVNGLDDYVASIIIENNHVKNLYELKHNKLLTKKQYNIVRQHFKVGDNLFRDLYFYISIAIMTICIAFGSCLEVYFLAKKTIDQYILSKKFEKIINSKIKEDE